MKLELKNVKYSEHLSEETYAFTANLYADGEKFAIVRNTGDGAPTSVFHEDGKGEKFNQVATYCKSLPDNKFKFGDCEHFYPSNIEVVVDNLFEEWLKAKEVKKMEKKMEDSLLWGIPNDGTYRQVKYRMPLVRIPHNALQQEINKFKKQFKEGEVFLNTNLEGFAL